MTAPPFDLAGARRQAHLASERCRLPFGRRAWRGGQGNWLGAGIGSSIDFQDHRAYMPGDDPRYIHWAAYARTGQLTMKLYRAEVAPFVDIVVDGSTSMIFTAEKGARLASLLAFCVESADRINAPFRVHAANEKAVRALSNDAVRAGRWLEALPPASGAGGISLTSVPWRAGALKILISDLLFAADPAMVFRGMVQGGGFGLVFVPTLATEAELIPRGNVEWLDCETGARRSQRVDDALATRYRAAYLRHFELWREAARVREIAFARIPCEGSLGEALLRDGLQAGAIELNR